MSQNFWLIIEKLISFQNVKEDLFDQEKLKMVSVIYFFQVKIGKMKNFAESEKMKS